MPLFVFPSLHIDRGDGSRVSVYTPALDLTKVVFWTFPAPKHTCQKPTSPTKEVLAKHSCGFMLSVHLPSPATQLVQSRLMPTWESSRLCPSKSGHLTSVAILAPIWETPGLHSFVPGHSVSVAFAGTHLGNSWTEKLLDCCTCGNPWTMSQYQPPYQWGPGRYPPWRTCTPWPGVPATEYPGPCPHDLQSASQNLLPYTVYPGNIPIQSHVFKQGEVALLPNPWK